MRRNFDRLLGGEPYKETACHAGLYRGFERVLLPENFEELELIWCALANLFGKFSAKMETKLICKSKTIAPIFQKLSFA